MAYTATDLTRIQAAIARGELRVDYADRSVTYRSIDDLLKAEARIIQALATQRPKQAFGRSCKGF